MLKYLNSTLGKLTSRTSLVVQWLSKAPARVGDMGSIPGQGRAHVPQSNGAHAQLKEISLLQLLKPVCEEPVLHNQRSHRNKSAHHS